MKKGLLLLSIPLFPGSLVLLGFGFVGLRDSHRYSTLHTATYAQVSAQHPSEGWYRITGCQLNLTQTVQELQNGRPMRVYAPIFDAQNPSPRKTHIFAEIDDKPTIHLLDEMQDKQKAGNPQALSAWLEAHRAELLPTRDVTGLISRGLRDPFNDIGDKFDTIADVSVPDLTIIGEGWKPFAGIATAKLVMGGIGLLLSLLGLGSAFRRKSVTRTA